MLHIVLCQDNSLQLAAQLFSAEAGRVCALTGGKDGVFLRWRDILWKEFCSGGNADRSPHDLGDWSIPQQLQQRSTSPLLFSFCKSVCLWDGVLLIGSSSVAR